MSGALKRTLSDALAAYQQDDLLIEALGPQYRMHAVQLRMAFKKKDQAESAIAAELKLRNEKEQEGIFSGHSAQPGVVRGGRWVQDCQPTQSRSVKCGGEHRQAAISEEPGHRDPRAYTSERTTTTGEAGRSLNVKRRPRRGS
jgi:hypothetical protein